jgi:RNA polymerase sigma-70 factor (ECF subfamily)
MQTGAPNYEGEFEQIFKAHFTALHAYAYTILKNSEEAEEVVQNLFVRLWEKREVLSVQSSVKAYLYRAVYNESINHLRHKKVEGTYKEQTAYIMKNETEKSDTNILTSELEKRIRLALNSLPEQCRTIFQMSRFEELKYKEIADQLGISIKTVENQIGKALRKMRVHLTDYLPIILLITTSLIYNMQQGGSLL